MIQLNLPHAERACNLPHINQSAVLIADNVLHLFDAGILAASLKALLMRHALTPTGEAHQRVHVFGAPLRGLPKPTFAKNFFSMSAFNFGPGANVPFSKLHMCGCLMPKKTANCSWV